jgi:hypothetical protein
MVTWKVLDVENYLLVILIDVAAGTQWGSSCGMERVCGRGRIRKSCGKVLDEGRNMRAEISKATRKNVF